MKTRRSIQIVRFGGPEAFELRELACETLSPGHIRIAVKAAGVNFADVVMRIGAYPEAPPKPFTPGYEVAGVVTEVATDVTGLKVGDRVVAGCRFGGYTSEIVVPAFQARPIPEGLSEVEAAAIPVNFMTAWVALEDMARVRKGDRVLIHSAAGGVGVAAIQIAARRGAHVVGLTSSQAKFDAIKDLGCHEFILNSDWDSKPDSAFGLFDSVLDSTGGASLKRSYRRLKQGGRVVNFGVSTLVSGERRSLITLIRGLLQTPIFTPFGLMMTNRGVFGLNMLKLFDPTGDASQLDSLMGRAFTQSLEGFKRGGSAKPFQVKIGKTFPLEKAGEAHTYLQSRGNVGKVVLTTAE